MKTFPKPLTVKEEKYYLQKYKEGDEEAKQILIERNLRLVAHVAKKYQHPDEDADENENEKEIENNEAYGEDSIS